MNERTQTYLNAVQKLVAGGHIPAQREGAFRKAYRNERVVSAVLIADSDPRRRDVVIQRAYNAISSGQDSASSATDHLAGESPGDTVAQMISILAGIVIAVGLIAASALFIAASEYGSTLSHWEAVTVGVQAVVAGLLLLAISTVIKLLRRIDARLATPPEASRPPSEA